MSGDVTCVLQDDQYPLNKLLRSMFAITLCMKRQYTDLFRF